MTASRHVYHLAGYDAARAQTHYRLFAGGLEQFKRTWNVDAALSGMTRHDVSASWTASTRAAGWCVDTVYEVLLWSDLVRDGLARPLTTRLLAAARSYLDYIASGTVLRFAAASWRYAVYFFYPLLMFALFAGCGWIFGRLLSKELSAIGLNAVLVGPLAGLVIFAGLTRSLGERLRLRLLLEVWSFAGAYVHRRHPGLDARLDRFAKLIVERARGAAVDEIVIVGHSIGAMLAIDVLDRALHSDPDFVRAGPAVCLLTVGASIPKVALHPGAGRAREAIARVAAEPAIGWAEIQSRDDFVSFYKFDPVALKPLAGDRLDGKPVVRRVQIHDMLKPRTFWRHRLHLLRLHYQCVMANEKPCVYDYFLAMCGPTPFARWTMSPRGLLDFVAADIPCAQPASDMTMAPLADRMQV